MKNFIILFLISFLTFNFSYSQIDQNKEDFECFYFNDNGEINSRMIQSSTYGKAFTPKGDFRMLVIYVNYNPATLVPVGGEDYELSGWPKDSEFPEFQGQSVVDLVTGDLLWGHDEFSDFAPLGNPPPDAYNNLSEYYYQMSNGEFRVYFETLEDPVTGLPTSITIDPTGITSHNAIVSEVFNQIETDYSSYDWSRFDMRSGLPNYLTDLSDPCVGEECDKVLDYVFLVFRNSNLWVPHPNGSTDPAGTGWPKGVANLGGIHEIGNGYQASSGFRFFHFSNQMHNRFEIYTHEIAHTYYDSPHTLMANFVHAKYFYSNYGWGMMKGYRDFMSLSNAWERWYSGWIDITHDVDETLTSETTFTIKDYLEFGHAMRIKLPHTQDQFIWLENHANETNPFYNRPAFNQDAIGGAIPQHKKGLYGFVERIANDTTEVGVFNQGANGIKLIYGKGNFDYTFDGFYNRTYFWGNDALSVFDLGENAYGGHHEASWFRHDYDNDGEITYMTGTNGGSGMTENEGGQIVEINQEKNWGFTGPNLVLPLKKLSSFSNPALTNFQEFEKTTNRMSPIVLHSLSLTLSEVTRNQIDVLVNYQDGHIENDFRMTGNIYLPSNETIVLDSEKELLFNRSKTTNLYTEVNDSFISYTNFIAAQDSELILKFKSTIILDEGSTIIFDSNSTLTMEGKSIIYIRNGSLLCIKEFVNIGLSPSAQIIVEDGFLIVDPSLDISTNVVYTDDYFDSVDIFTDVNYCSVTSSPEHIHSTGETYVSGSSCSISPFVLETTDKVKLTSEHFIEINSEFEVPLGAFFSAEILKPATDCDIDFFFGSSGVPAIGRESIEKTTKEKEEEPFEILIFPNPSEGEFNVVINKEFNYIEYNLFDFSGNTILEGSKYNASSFVISKRTLEDGIYLLKIITNDGIATVKVVIY